MLHWSKCCVLDAVTLYVDSLAFLLGMFRLNFDCPVILFYPLYWSLRLAHHMRAYGFFQTRGWCGDLGVHQPSRGCVLVVGDGTPPFV